MKFSDSLYLNLLTLLMFNISSAKTGYAKNVPFYERVFTSDGDLFTTYDELTYGDFFTSEHEDEYSSTYDELTSYDQSTSYGDFFTSEHEDEYSSTYDELTSYDQSTSYGDFFTSEHEDEYSSTYDELTSYDQSTSYDEIVTSHDPLFTPYYKATSTLHHSSSKSASKSGNATNSSSKGLGNQVNVKGSFLWTISPFPVVLSIVLVFL